jgi:hypothetical protein
MLDVGPAGQAAACGLLAQDLGVLLGDPVHQERDHDRGDQRIGGQAPAGGVEDHRGDDGAVDPSGAAPPGVVRRGL